LAEMCALPRSVDLRRFADAVKNRVLDAPEAELAPARASVRLPKADSASLAGGATSTELAPGRTPPTDPAVPLSAERASTAPAVLPSVEHQSTASERASIAPQRASSAPAERPSGEPAEHRSPLRAESSSHSASKPVSEASSSSIPRGDARSHQNGMAGMGDGPRLEENSAPLLEATDRPEDPWAGVLAEIARVKPSLQGFLSGSRASVLDGSILRVQ